MSPRPRLVHKTLDVMSEHLINIQLR